MYYQEDDPYAVANGDDKDSNQNLFGDYTTNPQETVGSHWTPALICSALALISAIICTVIGWILFDHWKNDWLLSFSIISTVAVLLFGFFAFWAFNNNRKRKGDAEYHPSAITELIVWVMALLFMAFFLVAGVAMFVYFPFHESYMREMKADADYWERKWGDDLPSEWEKENNLLIVIAAFSLVASACMIIVAFNTFSMSIRRYNLNVTLFLVAALGVFAFGFGVVVHHQDIKWWSNLYHNQDNYAPYKVILFFLFIFACVAIVMAFLNVLLSYTRNSFFYFFFLFAVLLLCIIVAILVAEYGRSLQDNISADMWKNGRSVLYETHQEDAKKFCDSTKYLNLNKACSNGDVVKKWETSHYELASLNQNCYGEASRFMYWKYFIMFLLGMFLVVFLVLLTLTNLFLLRDPETQKPNVFYLVVVGLMALAAIGLGIYLGLGYKPSDRKTYLTSNMDIEMKFKTVDPELSRPTETTVNKLCSKMSEMKGFSLNGNETDYGRLAILVQNGTINNHRAFDLGPNQRLAFFNDLNSNNNFYLMKGTKKQLNEALGNSEFCSDENTNASDAYFKWEVVPENALNSNALKSTENPNMPALTENGTSYDGSGSSKNIRSCDSNCLSNLDLSSDTKVKFVAPLIVRTHDNKPGLYKFPETKLRVEMLNEDYSKIDYAVITDKSQILLNLHTYVGKGNNVLLRITDLNDYYTQNIIKMQIPSKEQIDSGRTSTTLPVVVLATKDGKGCAGLTDVTKYNECVKNGKKDWKNGHLNISVFDGITGEMVDLPVVVSKYHADDKYHVETLTTTDGKAKSSSLKYGAYNLSVESEKYEKRIKYVVLQTESQNVSVILLPKDGNKDRLMNISDVGNSQFDLNLMMENKNKDQCIVNSFNKICPGAKMVADYVKNNKKVQIIDVEDYKNANYMTFYSPVQKFTSSCELSNQFSKRRLSGTSFGGWNMSSFDSLLSFVNGMDFFESSMGDSDSTNNNTYLTPITVDSSSIDNAKPYIGKQPNYNLIYSIIDKEYESPEEKTKAMAGLAETDEEKNKIVKAGHDIYNELDNKEDRGWMNEMEGVIAEEDEEWKYDGQVEEDYSFDDYEYDVNEVIEEKEENVDELCEYFGLCFDNEAQGEEVEEQEVLEEEEVEEDVVESTVGDSNVKDEVIVDSGVSSEEDNEEVVNEEDNVEEEEVVEEDNVDEEEVVEDGTVEDQEEVVEDGTTEEESVIDQVNTEKEPVEDEVVEEEVKEDIEEEIEEPKEEVVVEEGTVEEDNENLETEVLGENEVVEEEVVEDDKVEEEVVEDGTVEEDQEQVVEEKEEEVEEDIQEEPKEDAVVEDGTVEEEEETVQEESLIDQVNPVQEPVEDQVEEETEEDIEEDIEDEVKVVEDGTVEEENVVEEGTTEEPVQEEVVEEGEVVENGTVEEEEVVEDNTVEETDDELVNEEPQIIPGTDVDEVVEQEGEELPKETNLAPAEEEVFEDEEKPNEKGNIKQLGLINRRRRNNR